jgi:hypothetical protein
MPGTTNVGKNIRELTAINDTPARHRGRAQIIAIAESEARAAKEREHHPSEGQAHHHKTAHPAKASEHEMNAHHGFHGTHHKHY